MTSVEVIVYCCSETAKHSSDSDTIWGIISYDTLATICITLFVFIMGLILNETLKYFSKSIEEKNEKTSFHNMLNEVYRKLKIRIKDLEKFIPTLRINYDEKSRELPKINYTYVDAFFQQSISVIIKSFVPVQIFNFKRIFCKKKFDKNVKLKLKTINKIWSLMNIVKSMEIKQDEEFKTFSEKYILFDDEFKKEYRNISYLWNKSEQSLQSTIPNYLTLLQVKPQYIIQSKLVFLKFSKLPEKEQNNVDIVYKKLIDPLITINISYVAVADLNFREALFDARKAYLKLEALYEEYHFLYTDNLMAHKNIIRILNKCVKILS